jgi:hypothetical protein
MMMMASLRLFPLLLLLVLPVGVQADPGTRLQDQASPTPEPSPVVAPVVAPLSVSGHFAAGVSALAGARGPGDLLAAVSHFQAILEQGVVHEDVYYNLGNAYFHLDRLGPAVYHFEKALAIHPGHANARYNLLLTRQVLAQKYKDEIVQMGRQGTWVRLVKVFSDATITAVFLVFWILLFSALMALYFVRRPLLRLTLITAAVILGLGSAVFGSLLVGREIHDRTSRFAIVLPDQVEVREAPQASANRAFVLHAGHRVLTGASERAWVKILLPNGMEGWLERKDLGLL